MTYPYVAACSNFAPMCIIITATKRKNKNSATLHQREDIQGGRLLELDGDWCFYGTCQIIVLKIKT